VSVIFEIRFASSARAVFGFLFKKFLQIAQIGLHEASHVAKTHSRAPREAPFQPPLEFD